MQDDFLAALREKREKSAAEQAQPPAAPAAPDFLSTLRGQHAGDFGGEGARGRAVEAWNNEAAALIDESPLWLACWLWQARLGDFDSERVLLRRH